LFFIAVKHQWPQIYLLKTRHICYLTVSMDQELGRRLTEFSAQYLAG
jgi:hypothetical protein